MKKSFYLISLILIGVIIFSFKNKNRTEVNVNVDPIERYMDSLRTAMIGKEFSNLLFTDTADNKFDLQSLRGNIVAINIWAFGCKPCITEIPELNMLVDKYKDKPVKFISINGYGGKIDFKNPSALNSFKQLNFKYLTVCTDKQIKELNNVQFIFPQHIVLDKKGVVIDYFFGPQTNRLDSLININK